MKAIEWTAIARNDLQQIDDYWMSVSPDQADAILAKIEAAGNFLTTMPHAGPALDQGLARKWNVLSTPYVLIYRITAQSIQVLRVHHSSQNWRADA